MTGPSPEPAASASAPAVPEDPALLGTLRARGAGTVVFGRFRLSRELGAGGMAVVWLAHDERLGIEVALKFLPGMVARDPEALHDLRREITRGLRLTHPGIVRLYDLHEDSMEDLAAIAMEYVEGCTLSEEKARQPQRCFDVEEPLISWTRTFCEVIQYVHEQAKVIHRDLKPRNLMLTTANELKVADFGIASTFSESQSRATQFVGTSGTPAYMSPQQAAGRVPSPADDIYAIGATLYELITSKPPFFRGSVPAILNQVASEAPPTMQERRVELEIVGRAPIPAVWEETIAACLAKDPQARPASVREVRTRLGLAEGREPGGSLLAASAEAGADLARGSRQRRFLWLAVLIVALAAVAMFAARGRLMPRKAPTVSVTPHSAAVAQPGATPDASFAFARDLCFDKDEWAKGLTLLAKHEGPLQKPAQLELQWPKGSKVEIARAWLDAADHFGEPDKWHCFRRGRYWFRAALAAADPDSTGIRAEMARIPSLKVVLHLKGSSPLREDLEIRRNWMLWTGENGGDPTTLAGPRGELSFNLQYGHRGTRPITHSEMRQLLPDGLDFSTAKLGATHFSGKTGGVSRVLSFEILKDPNPPAGVIGDALAVQLRFGEKPTKGVWVGAFDYSVDVVFGE